MSDVKESATTISEDYRLLKQLLNWADREQATAIRVTSNEAKRIVLDFELNGEWREQAKWPAFVWTQLRTEIIDFASCVKPQQHENETDCHFTVQFTIALPGEEMILKRVQETFAPESFSVEDKDDYEELAELLSQLPPIQKQ